MSANKRALLAGVVLSATLPGIAYAQEDAPSITGDLGSTAPASNFARDRNVSVRERQHPGYEALGLSVGAFMLWPKISTTAEYNDNIYATPTDPSSDTIWHINPSVTLTSNWSRNAVQAYAQSWINEYTSHTTENTTDYAIGTNDRLDVTRNAQITGGLDFSHLTEPRTAATSEGLAFPTEYEVGSAYLAGSDEFNRLRVSGRLEAHNYTYLNRTGNPQQHDRDRLETAVTGRVDYAVSPDTAIFVEVTGNDHDYRLSSSPVANGVPVYPFFQNRNSSGADVLAGANFDITQLIRGEIGLGYLHQSYQNPAFHDVSGFGARAQVDWFPTQLITVSFTGSRTLQDAGLIGASSYLSTNVGAQADYELLRDLLVSASVGYGQDDYRGIVRTDKRYVGGVSATYLVNRNVGVSVGYSRFKQDSTDPFSNFTVNKISATLTLQY